jgi:hypothetical protein
MAWRTFFSPSVFTMSDFFTCVVLYNAHFHRAAQTRLWPEIGCPQRPTMWANLDAQVSLLLQLFPSCNELHGDVPERE